MKNILIGILTASSMCLSLQSTVNAQSTAALVDEQCIRAAYSTDYFREFHRGVCDLMRLQEQQQQLRQQQQQLQQVATQQAPSRILYVWTVKDDVNLRTGPHTSSAVITTMPMHTVLRVHSNQDGWAWVTIKNTNTYGWIRQDMIGMD